MNIYLLFATSPDSKAQHFSFTSQEWLYTGLDLHACRDLTGDIWWLAIAELVAERRYRRQGRAIHGGRMTSIAPAVQIRLMFSQNVSTVTIECSTVNYGARNGT